MATQSNRLEDYEEAVEGLLKEIREYQAINQSLRGMAASLTNIQELNAAAGKTLWSIGADASQVVKSVKSLQLDKMESRANHRYTTHQTALDALNENIRSAVREQQRSGLEMLQHTSASQKEFAAFVKQVEQSSADARDRGASLEEQLKSLSSTIANDLTVLNSQIALIRNILFASIALIVIVGIVALMR